MTEKEQPKTTKSPSPSTESSTASSKKQLTQYEIDLLIQNNSKYLEEIKNYKSQIVELNDKINEQIVTITDNKLKYDQESKINKEKYEKEIKNLKEKIENNNGNQHKIETEYKFKMNEIEKDKQLLMMTNKNLENQISDLNTKINQINLENESQLKLFNDSKKKTIKDYNDQIDELKNKYEALQTK